MIKFIQKSFTMSFAYSYSSARFFALNCRVPPRTPYRQICIFGFLRIVWMFSVTQNIIIHLFLMLSNILFLPEPGWFSLLEQGWAGFAAKHTLVSLSVINCKIFCLHFSYFIIHSLYA